MTKAQGQGGGDLFIVDNSDSDWKVARYLSEWAPIARQLDVATGFFEIGGLLAIGDAWGQIDKIRILMGDEVSLRTKQAFQRKRKLKEIAADVCRVLDKSIEQAKLKDDFLTGVDQIVEALRSSQIECRVYRKDRFHAKAYITHARSEIIGSFALVGSSNLTKPGLTDNVELNVRFGGAEVSLLQDWYERHWEDAEDVTPEVLRTVERHTREYSPFEVYAQSLHHLFRDAPSPAREWEEREVKDGGSRVFKLLDGYQKDGYRNLMHIADRFNGAFLCDGVGLGKTFVGMMVLERLLRFDRKRVVLIVPKAGRKAVWEASLRSHCPDLMRQAFQNLQIINHTDITRQASEDVDWPALMEELGIEADAVVIDEAHHFRNPGRKANLDPESGKLVTAKGEKPPSRYQRLRHMLAAGPTKQVFLLTATPINNHIDDLRHMIELFTAGEDKHFAETMGINSLKGHFRKLEKAIEREMRRRHGETDAAEVTMVEAGDVLDKDKVFEELVVQRSRAHIKRSQQQEGGRQTTFPERQSPKVAEYNVKKTYGALLDKVDEAFKKDKPLFRLSIYYPFEFARTKTGDAEQKIIDNRQKQVVGLVRTNFLKRFESSAKAFEGSCERLFLKLLAWAEKHVDTDHEEARLDRVKQKYAKVIGRVQEHVPRMERHQLGMFDGDGDEPEEDIIPPEMLEAVQEVDREQFDVPAILDEALDDLREIAGFLEELQKFDPKHDDKLNALIKLLKTDAVLKKHKVLIFTEFADTARYLEAQLRSAGIEGVERIDGGTNPNGRLEVIRRFSPYYNGTTSGKLADAGEEEIRVLISTDVLSEGLNLQDATRLINYDLHWNPVRLMQRIGRVDRRLNPSTEALLVHDHPDQKSLRGGVAYWNFLPPDDLDELLALYRRVAHKTLRISRVFGIEGRKLLTPDDDYEALKNFNDEYEGVETDKEKLRSEYRELLLGDPELAERLDALPGRVFSGRQFDAQASEMLVEGRGVFFCYAVPGRDRGVPIDAPLVEQWTEWAGEARWYLYDLASGEVVLREPTEIAPLVRSTPDTERICREEATTLAQARKAVEQAIERDYLRGMNAPAGVRARLVAWMELTK